MKRNLLLMLLFFGNTCIAQSNFQKKVSFGVLCNTPSMGALSNCNIIICTLSNSSAWGFGLTMFDTSGNISWSKMFNVAGAGDEAYYPIQISDGNFLIAGYNSAGIGGGLMIAKFDPSGNVIWAKAIGGSGGEVSYFHAVETHDKNITALGWTMSFGAGIHDFYFVKTDPLGNLLWAKSYGGSNIDVGQCFMETKDNGFILVGTTRSFNAPNDDIYVIKIDSLGNPLWSRKYGTSVYDIPYSVNETPDKGFLIAGVNNFWTAFLLKVDSIGNIEWSKRFNNIYGYPTAEVLPGFVIIFSANVNDAINGTSYPCVLKLDSLGNVFWNRAYKNSSYFANCGFHLTPDGSFNFLGVKWGPQDTLLVVRTDSIWNSHCTEGTFIADVANLIFQDTMVSTIVDSGGTAVNAILPVTNMMPFIQDGCIPVAINEMQFTDSKTGVSPNPFTTEITLTFQNQNVRQIFITVENVLGQTVFKLQENNSNAIYTKTIDLRFLSKGIYLLDAIIDGDRTVKKIVKE